MPTNPGRTGSALLLPDFVKENQKNDIFVCLK
jgi:hypothetical protein